MACDISNQTENYSLRIRTFIIFVNNIIFLSFSYCLANFTSDNGTTANFGYLVCLNNDENIMFVVKGSLMTITVVFLLVTLLIYFIVPDLRLTLDKVTVFSVLSLMFFMLFLSMIQFQVFASSETISRVVGNLLSI